jgi:diacylglycerol kinase (ATP)
VKLWSHVNQIVVISNPHSKRNRKDPSLHQDLEGLLGEWGRVESPDGFQAINALAKKLLLEKPEVIAVNGGDGTLGVLMTALNKAWDDSAFPPILLLRGGTMNTVAKNLRLKGKPRKILQQALQRLKSGDGLKTKTRWMLIVNGRLGFWFGNGVVSNFMRPYYTGSPPSPLKGLYVLFRAVASAMVGGGYAKRITAPANCTLEVDGRLWPQSRWLALGMGTLIDAGLGFRIFYRLREEQGKAHVLGFACSPFRMAMTVPKMYRGYALEHPDMVDVSGTDVCIKGSGTLHYMVDGDLLSAEDEIHIQVSRPIQLVVPRRS